MLTVVNTEKPSHGNGAERTGQHLPHLSPDETPAQDEQRTLREPLFQDACACNFFALPLSCCTGWRQSEGGENAGVILDTPPAQETICLPRRTPARDFR